MPIYEILNLFCLLMAVLIQIGIQYFCHMHPSHTKDTSFESWNSWPNQGSALAQAAPALLKGPLPYRGTLIDMSKDNNPNQFAHLLSEQGACLSAANHAGGAKFWFKVQKTKSFLLFSQFFYFACMAEVSHCTVGDSISSAAATLSRVFRSDLPSKFACQIVGNDCN